MANRIILRNGTASEWITYDPILYEGEIGIETDTNKFKIGNGSDLWTELPYIGVSKTGDSMSGILNMLQNKIINVASPIDSKDVANKEYVDISINSKMPISGGILENYREKLTTVSASGGSIDLSLGNVFQHAPSGDTAYTISNAVAGQAHSFTLIINMGATVRTLTFSASVKWQGGEIPDLTTASKTYVLTFVSVDGGTTWLGMFGGEF